MVAGDSVNLEPRVWSFIARLWIGSVPGIDTTVLEKWEDDRSWNNCLNMLHLSRNGP